MLVASNLASAQLEDRFQPGLRMWVRQEELPDGRLLTDVVNESNENIRYLPGVKLGHNVTATPDLEVRPGQYPALCLEFPSLSPPPSPALCLELYATLCSALYLALCPAPCPSSP